jgi:GPH family glycoside/pentoside/hexuronide:cation symporter
MAFSSTSPSPEVSSEAPVPTSVAAFWGLGTFATTTMLNGVSVLLLFFLVTYAQMEPAIAGAFLFAAKIIDVITDPFIGAMSDRTRTKWGRRRPYLLFASVFCGLSFVLLFNLPEFGDIRFAYAYVIAAIAIYSISYATFNIPYMAMPAEMTRSYHERTRIMSFRVFFMTLGNAMGAAGCAYLVSLFGNTREAYAQMGIVVGALICVVMILTFVGTRDARQTDMPADRIAPWQHLKLLVQNQPLIVLMGTKILLYAGISATTAVLPFFIINALQKGPDGLALYGVTVAVATVLFIPVCARLTRYIEKRNAYAICLVGNIALLLSWLAATPDESTILFMLRAFGVGAVTAGNFLYSNSMLIDTFAHDYQLTGLRREGVLSASFAVVEKSALAIGPLIIGVLLSYFGYERGLPPSAAQSPQVVKAMLIGFIWIPVAIKLTVITLLFAYRLRQSSFEPADKPSA